MKIKLLLAPSMIVISIVLLIWFVYPAYTNPDGSGVVEKKAELDKSKAQLENISNKSEMVKNLAKNLLSGPMTSVRDTVMNFIPENIEEYEIINNLNYIVLKEELSGSLISVSQPKESEPSSLEADPMQATSLEVPNAGTGDSLATVPVSVTPKAKVFEVEFSVQGNYAKIKSVFQKICSLKRFNRVMTLEIEPVDTEGTTEASTNGSDNLKATATLEFAYLKQTGEFSSIEDGVFSKNTFDTKIADLINEKKNTPLLPDLQVDQKGKTNPFMP